MIEFIKDYHIYIIAGLTGIIIVSSIVICIQSNQIAHYKEMTGLSTEDWQNLMTFYNNIKESNLVERLLILEEHIRTNYKNYPDIQTNKPGSPQVGSWIASSTSTSTSPTSIRYTTNYSSYEDIILDIDLIGYSLIIIILVVISLYLINYTRKKLLMK